MTPAQVTILVVDETQAQAAALESVLQEAGYRTEIAPDQDAVEELLAAKPTGYNLLLVRPPGGGLVTEAIYRNLRRQTRGQTPILLIADQPPRPADPAPIFYDIVTPDYTPHELVARVRNALHAHRIEQELSQRNIQLGALVAITEALTQFTDQETMLDQALQVALNYLNREAGLVYMADPDDQREMQIAACVGLSREQAARLLDDKSGPLAAALARVQETARLAIVQAAQGGATAVPLRIRPDMTGALIIPDAVEDEDQQMLLLGIGLQIGLAVHKTQLYAQALARSREQTMLRRIESVLSSSLQVDETLDSTMHAVREIMNVGVGILVKTDNNGDQPWLTSTSDECVERWFKHCISVPDGIVRRCLSTGKPLIVNEQDGEALTCIGFDPQACDPIHAAMCIPLRTKDQTLGVIAVVNKETGPFDGHDLNLLRSVGISVATAVDNAQLFHRLTVANVYLEASRQEIQRSRQMLQALFDSITDDLYIINQNYQLLAVNAACAQRAGQPAYALAGRLCYVALFVRETPCMGCRVMETLETGSETRSERRMLSNDRHREYTYRTYPVPAEDSEERMAVVLAQDETEMRQLEASLAQSEKLAALGQLAAGMAHEINNPLTAIIANAQLLLPAIEEDTEDRESLDLIIHAGRRIREVVQSVLGFARRKETRIPQLTDVNDTLLRAVEMARVTPHTEQAALTLNLDPNLPAIQGHPNDLEGVWLNLLLNAYDATEACGGEIVINSQAGGDAVLVIVSDTGEGIAPGDLPHVFEPFFTTKQPNRGTGLGLSMCYRVIEQHGGQIQIQSEQGRGTTVTIRLPIEAALSESHISEPG